MAEFYEPKKDVYAILNSVSSSVKVYQERPEVIKDFPSFTYSIEDNTPMMLLNKDIGYQDIEIKVDIWATTSKESGTLLKALVGAMLEGEYLLTFNKDIADPSGNSHITTRFKFIK